jgi:hypothetical protein
MHDLDHLVIYRCRKHG